MKSDRLKTLKAELLDDMRLLDELEGKYRLIHAKLASITPDEFDYVGLAYTIVNLYSLMERIIFYESPSALRIMSMH